MADIFIFLINASLVDFGVLVPSMDSAFDLWKHSNFNTVHFAVSLSLDGLF